ncbi:peptidase M48 [Litorivita pollutaquae]|uniref:Peptidase M48 n=1 Tax=Litorivita pollutaquae TaxID=2200892 RepID=A0A2V4NPS8_9RHOB|nr:M48 family metallopeptidase [Litorivita pollutaquae]PYC48447.1 peptidase M48 [Litorivita pollutaquae]
MLRVLPILLAVGFGLVMYLFSVRRTLSELDEKSSELVDPSLNDSFARLAAALDLPRVRVYLYEIEPVNGLAAPDGRIFITRGFYNKFRSGEVTADELTTVIAHELGHVALGHSKRRMIDFSAQNALRMVLITLLAPFLRQLAVYAANFLASLLTARLSRGDEYEADEYAAALLTKAGIGTEPQKSLFRKLMALTGGNAGKAPAWLLSHPKTEDRIRAIETLEKKWAVT